MRRDEHHLRAAHGLFVPKPSSYVGKQVLSVGWPAETVRGCPWESAYERGDRHSISHPGDWTAVDTRADQGCLPAVVDELRVEVTATCASAPKSSLACGYTSQRFSLVRAGFDAPVPSICPGRTSGSLASLAACTVKGY